MRKIVNALAEATKLCLTARESYDPALRTAAYRAMVLLERATDRVTQIKEMEDENA